MHEEILGAGVLTQEDAHKVVTLLAGNSDAQVQFTVNALRVKFQKAIEDSEERKEFVYLLARFVKSYHFLRCFFTYPKEIQEFAAFAEYVGPQLIKQGTISDLMKQIRQTDVVKASVQYQGEVRSGGPVKLQKGKGKKGSGPPPKKVSVQEMIAQIRQQFDITDEEALYIREVTEEKMSDVQIKQTVEAHKADVIYLEEVFRGQVNHRIQTAFEDRDRYDELADPKYTDPGAIFDIMAFTVIQQNLYESQAA